MKTVWILGWLWPETTANFYLRLNSISKNEKNRIPILIWNTSIDLEIEKEFLLNWNWIKKFLPFLKEGIKNLIKWGADFIVIPCNSVHWLIKELREYSTIPIISIIEETVKYIKKNNINNVWILSSWYTEKHKLYENILKKDSITIFKLNSEKQRRINELILKLVLNYYTDKDKNIIENYIQDLLKVWAEKILLWCTDLQILVNKSKNIFDSMEILLVSTYEKIIKLKKWNKKY